MEKNKNELDDIQEAIEKVAELIVNVVERIMFYYKLLKEGYTIEEIQEIEKITIGLKKLMK